MIWNKTVKGVVVEHEKTRLIMEGREDLADKVFATSEIAGNAERFDVLYMIKMEMKNI